MLARTVSAALVVTALVGLLSLSGCVTAPDDFEPLVAPLVDPGSAEEAGLLAFVNDPATTFELLDVDVALDRRAAENILAHRDGADGLPGTADDRLFATYAELDAISYVGSVALSKLLEYATEHGYVGGATVDRDVATLALVNDPATTFELLDIDVGLDRRAAENIMAARPFASIAALDAVSYVGPAALDQLAAYALEHGYGASEPPAETPCALISEYTEGQGNYNKGVEIFNCGSTPVAADTLGLCLVRNGDTTCTTTATLGPATIGAGDVLVGCRTTAGTFNDPMDSLRHACDVELSGVATFNGDDRLILFHDADADGGFGAADTVLDTFGDPAVAPSTPLWADATYRRCDLAPRVSGHFSVEDYFTTHARHDHTHLGVPPTDSCGETQAAAEGDACTSTEACAEGLRCYGRPNDGSSPFGRCVDPTPIPGEGASCDRWSPCDEETLICAGWTLWGEGTCVPLWMATRLTSDPAEPLNIPDNGRIEPSVIVEGLASVPVDIEVTLHIDHPRMTDLRVTLVDPNGDSAVLWDRTPELEAWSRSFVTTGISRDDQVNGRWTLKIEDMVTGETGVFHSWTLFVVSRWD